MHLESACFPAIHITNRLIYVHLTARQDRLKKRKEKILLLKYHPENEIADR